MVERAIIDKSCAKLQKILKTSKFLVHFLEFCHIGKKQYLCTRNWKRSTTPRRKTALFAPYYLLFNYLLLWHVKSLCQFLLRVLVAL